MLYSARKRSKTKNLDFNIELSDIQIPEFCPVLNIRLVPGRQLGAGNRSDDTPSLDRIVPSLGYTKGNVRVISWRANRLKSDATPEELENLYLDSRK